MSTTTPDAPNPPTVPRVSPYRGLRPYTENDEAFFFGRDAWREIIIDNLLAHRMTVLYGESGVGKSSVLRAGVVPELRRRQAEGDIPPLAAAVFDGWSDVPGAGLIASVSRAVEESFPGEVVPHPPAGSLEDQLGAVANRVQGRLIVILDQFEEYFVYHGLDRGPDSFASQLPLAVGDDRLRVHYLIAIREDAVAKLDRIQSVIPELFDNLLRIEPLDREAATAAITEPVARYNELFGASVEVDPELPDAVLDQVDTVSSGLDHSGLGVVSGEPEEQRIQAPYLQIVMERLWREEAAAGSTRLHVRTLERLGGAEAIVSHHLDDTMEALIPEQRFVAAHAFHYLVTPSGGKFAHTAPDLTEWTGESLEKVQAVLDALAGPEVRILRQVAPPRSRPDGDAPPRYEIHHDALGPAVLDWRARELAKALKSVRAAWVVAIVVNTLCVGVPVGALVLMPFLRRATPPFRWWEVGRIAASWVAGAFIGFNIGLILGVGALFLFDSPGEADTVATVIAIVIVGVVPAVFGPLAAALAAKVPNARRRRVL